MQITCNIFFAILSKTITHSHITLQYTHSLYFVNCNLILFWDDDGFRCCWADHFQHMKAVYLLGQYLNCLKQRLARLKAKHAHWTNQWLKLWTKAVTLRWLRQAEPNRQTRPPWAVWALWMESCNVCPDGPFVLSARLLWACCRKREGHPLAEHSRHPTVEFWWKCWEHHGGHHDCCQSRVTGGTYGSKWNICTLDRKVRLECLPNTTFSQSFRVISGCAAKSLHSLTSFISDLTIHTDLAMVVGGIEDLWPTFVKE